MSLVPSLLNAILRLEGDALVMHVGEKPYVVAPTGQVELASRPLNFDAVSGMVSQLLPSELQHALDEFGAVQYEFPSIAEFPGEHFSVVAARGGEDIWVEIRRRQVPDDRVPEEFFAQADAAARGQSGPPPAGSVAPPGAPATAQPSQTAEAPPPARPAAAPVSHVASVPAQVTETPKGDEAAQPAARVVTVPEARHTEQAPPAPQQVGPRAPAPAEPIAAEVEIETEAEVDLSTVGGERAAEEPRAAAAAEMPSAPSHEIEPAETSEVSRPAEAHRVDADSRTEPARPMEPAASPEPVRPISGTAGGPGTQFEAPIETTKPSATRASEPAVPVGMATEPAQPIEPARIDAAETHGESAAEVAKRLPSEPHVTAHVEAARVEPPAPQPPQPVEPRAEERADADAARVEAIHAAAAASAPQAAEAPREATEEPAAAARVEPATADAGSAAASRPAEVAQETEQTEAPAPLAAVTGYIRPVPSAVVLPMSRSPIRPEPPSPPVTAATGLDRLLRIAAARAASALYLTSQARPSIRVDGEIQPLAGEMPLSPGEVESLLIDLMPERNREELRSGITTEWICDVADVGRVRCMTFRDHRGAGGIFRMMPVRAISADQLGLSREIQALAAEPEGLVLVAGPRSSGKSTLVSAFVDLINRTRHDHVITIESEIKVVHEQRNSLVSQREVRGSTDEMLAVARGAIRENPDVLVMEELRTADMVTVALEAAGSGHLVIGALPAHTATGAVDRIIDLYPPEQRRHVQLSLAENLRGIVAQVLVRKPAGGRAAAREVLLNTPTVAGVIAEGKTSQLPVAIECGRKYGMVPLNDALAALVQTGAVDAREAYRRAADRAGFLALLKRQGIDTSFVERLA